MIYVNIMSKAFFYKIRNETPVSKYSGKILRNWFHSKPTLSMIIIKQITRDKDFLKVKKVGYYLAKLKRARESRKVSEQRSQCSTHVTGKSKLALNTSET